MASGCIFTNNSAAVFGGAAYQSQIFGSQLYGNMATNGGAVAWSYVDQCILTNNRALDAAGFGGGGALSSELRNSIVHKNHAVISGGAHASRLVNCTVTENSGLGLGPFSSAINCILWANSIYDYSISSTIHCSVMRYLTYSPGTNNLYTDPGLVDPFHISEVSICRGTAHSAPVSGTDWEGDLWLNPPSRGADEYVAGNVTGPLAVQLELTTNVVMVNRELILIGRVQGRASSVAWSFGDGPTTTPASYYVRHSWTNAGDYEVTFTAFNGNNLAGVSTKIVIHVLPLTQPKMTSVQRVGPPDYHYYNFLFATQIGATNTLEFATNLTPPVAWFPLKVSVATNDVMRETDYNPADGVRFYRIQAR